MQKLKISCLKGGRGPEREVSLRSGQACSDALKKLGHEVFDLDFKDREDIKALIDQKPDLVFIALHGEGGEDGQLQGLLEWAKIPYTGSGPAASSLCMDKWLSKLLFQKQGLPVAPALANMLEGSYQQWTESWGCEALFIKPRRGGSSVGAAILTSEEDWNREKASDPMRMVEPRLLGRDLTLSFVRREKRWKELPILELQPESDFYDYHSKYTAGKTHFILPANISESQSGFLQSIALQALECAEIRSHARVDILLDEQGPHILEINSLPGMTETSDLPAQAKAAGVEFEELVEWIVQAALEEV